MVVIARSPFDGPLTLEVNGQRQILAYDLAQLLFVIPQEPEASGQPG